MSLLSKAAKSVSAPVKKVASIAVNTGAGFVAGGGIGALAGTARGIYENTKTSKAESINLRHVGQAFVTGGVANIAAGAVAGGYAAAGGASGIVAKAAAFGKAGGLVGKALPYAAAFLKKSPQVLASTGETIGDTVAGQNGLANQVLSMYGRNKEGVSETSGKVSRAVSENLGTAAKVFKNRVVKDGNVRDAVDAARDQIFLPAPQNNGGSTPVVVSAGEQQNTIYIIAALAVVALFLYLKKR